MKKYLCKLDIFSIVVGSIIGWGSFMLPGTKFLSQAGVINTAIAFTLGALCIIIIERNYEVMLSIQKEEGGEFTFTYNNLGKKHGFIVGWFLTLAYFTLIPLNATAFPLVVKKLFGSVLEFGYLYTVAGYKLYIGEIIAASLIILVFTYFNIKGAKESSKIQNVMIVALILMVALVFMGMTFKGRREMFIETYVANYKFSIKEIAMVLAITPFAFIGFDAIPQLSTEYKFSARKASIVAIISLVVGALIYNALNIITALAYTPEEAVLLEWATGSAVMGILGGVAFFMLIIALCAAVWGGINGFMVCSSKLLGSIARYKMLPSKLGESNENGAYKNAILFLTAISLVAPWFGREVISWIVDMSSLGASVAYLYVSYIVYRKTDKKRGKVFSILGVIFSTVFILLLLLPMSPAGLGKEAMISLIIWCAMGILFYFSINYKYR